MGPRVGIPTDAVIINSLTVSPDPPKPGQDITVTVNATASKTIEVSGPDKWNMQYSLTASFRRVHTPLPPLSWD